MLQRNTIVFYRVGSLILCPPREFASALLTFQRLAIQCGRDMCWDACCGFLLSHLALGRATRRNLNEVFGPTPRIFYETRASRIADSRFHHQIRFENDRCQKSTHAGPGSFDHSLLTDWGAIFVFLQAILKGPFENALHRCLGI